MGKMRIQNKRRLTPFIEKNQLSNSNFIYNHLLAVKYSKEVVSALKEVIDRPGFCTTVRKRCRVLLAKMENPGMGSQSIARLTGTCRNFVDKVIHLYNDYGLQDVLFTEEKEGRPNRLGGQWHAVSEALVKGVPRSAKEAVNIIRGISGHTFSLTWARVLMRDAGMDYRKLQPVPGKADPEKQKEWIADIQPVVAEAEEGRRRLLFMDAVHFTLEAFTCKVWCKGQLYLPTGAGRNRFNLLGAIDPFSLDLVQSHSMKYVDAGQVKAFLEKVRDQSGDIPVSLILDNARYQHCQAVKDKAAELGIDLIFLPPYSPNLNIIERLWKYVRKEVLNARFFETPALFHDALRKFFEEDICHHHHGLKTLLTLKFQSFENAHLLCA